MSTRAQPDPVRAPGVPLDDGRDGGLDAWFDRWAADIAVDGRADPGIGPIRHAFDALIGRYREPHRRFHTVEHVLAVVAAAADGGGDRAVRLAAWYHDAVYDPTASDNEERSADLAAVDLAALGLGAPVLERVRSLILMTKAHQPDPTDEGAVALCRADLGILAADPDRYRRYVAQVRHEYGHVDDVAWRAGRGAFVRAMLARDDIVVGDAATDRRARRNLTAELDAPDGLDAPDTPDGRRA